jgi:hypothetical protein
MSLRLRSQTETAVRRAIGATNRSISLMRFNSASGAVVAPRFGPRASSSAKSRAVRSRFSTAFRWDRFSAAALLTEWTMQLRLRPPTVSRSPKSVLRSDAFHSKGDLR